MGVHLRGVVQGWVEEAAGNGKHTVDGEAIEGGDGPGAATGVQRQFGEVEGDGDPAGVFCCEGQI